MKEKSFLSHFIIIGSGTIISMAIGLITTPIITRIINTADYGEYSIFQMYANIALMVFCIGLDQSLMRFYYDLEDIDYKRKLLHKCTLTPIIITMILGIIIIMLSLLGINKFEFETMGLVLLVICVVFQIINRMTLIVLRLEFKSKVYSTINIIHKVIFIICILLLYYIFKNKNFYNLAISMTASYGIAAIIGILVQKELWKKEKNVHIYIDMKKIYRYGIPYIIAMGITTLFQAIDKISLNYYYGYSEVGIYASAMTLINIFAIIQTTFNALWTPLAIKHFNDNKEDRTFYSNGNKLITVIMFLLGITLILFKDIFVLLLGNAYRDAIYILPCLIFNPMMYTISETTVCGLVFKEKSKMQVIIAIISCIVNAIGNMILVPILGGKGAAISTGISYIVFFTVRTVISKYYFNVNYNLGKFYTLTIIVLIFALYNTFVKFNIITIIFYIIICLLIIVLYLDAVQQILRMMKEKFNNIIKLKR